MLKFERSDFSFSPESNIPTALVSNERSAPSVAALYCPDCGIALVRFGTCFSCPLCGLGSCE
ncbi:MAG: hypothetical protein HRF51_04625 [bacterium]